MRYIQYSPIRLYKTAADPLSMAARKHYQPGKWQHIKEVLRVARRFAGRSLTPVQRASILWHDSAKRDFGAEKHGLNGSKIAQQQLPKFGYTPQQVKTIATAIRQHNLDQRIDNQNSFKQTIKRFASPQAQLLALADDWRSSDIQPVWKKILSHNIKGKPTDRDAHDLYMHMTKRLSPMGRMPQLKYYGQKYKKSTDKFQKWLDSLTQQQVADRIQRWKEANNL